MTELEKKIDEIGREVFKLGGANPKKLAELISGLISIDRDQLIGEIEKRKEIVRVTTGSNEYDDCYNECILIVREGK